MKIKVVNENVLFIFYLKGNQEGKSLMHQSAFTISSRTKFICYWVGRKFDAISHKN